MATRLKYSTYFLTAMIFLALGVIAGKMEPRIVKEIEIIQVEKIKEQVRVVTVIKEHPDGSKETTIIKETLKETQKRLDKLVKERSAERDYLIGLSRDFSATPIYTLSVQRRILWGAYMGLYGRSDSEFGATLSYGF